jgi:hypothetical protein
MGNCESDSLIARSTFEELLMILSSIRRAIKKKHIHPCTVVAKSIFDAKCIISAKSRFSNFFNVTSKYLNLFRKLLFQILIKPFQDVKLNKSFLFRVLKMHFLKFSHFSDTFSATAITVAEDNFLASCFHILKGCPFSIRIASFIWGSGGTF